MNHGKEPEQRVCRTVGLVYFFGEDPHRLRDLLKHQEALDFYV
ncbi:hypothetical protein ACMDCT_07455 [Halomonadaceae bacterium KBTZ08]